MVNNDFRIIGTATTDFQKVVNKENFTVYYLNVEVEKLGSNVGSKIMVKVKFYNTNKAVNFYSNVRGHLVAVSGYLDMWFDKDKQSYETIPVGINVFLLDNGQIGINENIQGMIGS